MMTKAEDLDLFGCYLLLYAVFYHVRIRANNNLILKVKEQEKEKV